MLPYCFLFLVVYNGIGHDIWTLYYIKPTIKPPKMLLGINIFRTNRIQ